jgi:biotin carboxyl carrier protein
MIYLTTIGDSEFSVEILDARHVRIGGRTMDVNFESISGQPVYSLLIDGKSYEAYVYQAEDEWQVVLLGQQYQVKVEDERERRLRAAAGGKLEVKGDYQLKAPMPGLIVAVPVEENQQVQKGEVLVVLESMKMQNELRSPRAGRVERIKVKPGESVEQRQTLLSVT